MIAMPLPNLPAERAPIVKIAHILRKAFVEFRNPTAPTTLPGEIPDAKVQERTGITQAYETS